MRTFLNTILVNALVLMLLFVAGCDGRKSGSKNVVGNGVINIADFPRKNSVAQEDLYDTVSYIRLDTPHLIGKFDQVLFNDSMIVVLDKQNDKVFIHNRDGESIGLIDDKGKGAKEYISASQISLLDNGEIRILDKELSAVFSYTSRGVFVNQKRYDEYVSDYCFDGHYEYLFYGSRERKNAHHLDVLKNGLVHKSYFEYKELWRYGNPVFLSNLGQTFFHRRYDDNIYQFEDGELKVRYAFDFGNDSIVCEKLRNVKNLDEQDELLAQYGYVGGFMGLTISDKYIYFSYSNSNRKMIANTCLFYNKKNRTGFTFLGLGKRDENAVFVSSPSFSDGTHFYSLIDPSHLDEQQRHYFSKLFNCSITVESNCFLCQLTMKEEFDFE